MVYTRKKQRHARKKSVKRSRQGGAFLSQGTYGCTFSNPPLPCKGENGIRRPNLISKLMLEENARDEFRVNNVLSSIDPEQNYLLYPNSICEPDIQKIDEANITINTGTGFSKCKIIAKLQKKRRYNRNWWKNNSSVTDRFRLLFYKNGGQDLSQIKPRVNTYHSFFTSLVTIFQGIDLLHRNNLAHLDIKPHNLVSLYNDADRTFSSRIIDFGLMRPVKMFDTFGKYYESDDLSMFSQFYMYWPPELNILASIGYSLKTEDYDIPNNATYVGNFEFEDLESYESQLYGIITQHRTNSNNYMDWRLYAIDGRNMERFLSQIYPIKRAKSNNTNNNDDEITVDISDTTLYKPSTIVKSVDVYSLGIALGEIYTRLTGHVYLNGKTVGDNKSIYPKLFNDALIKDTVSKPFFELIFDMIHPIYEQRITIQQAMIRYIDLLPLFEQFTSTYRGEMGPLTRQTGFRIHSKPQTQTVRNKQAPLVKIPPPAGSIGMPSYISPVSKNNSLEIPIASPTYITPGSSNTLQRTNRNANQAI
jgi:serine/threonine protein kinase